MNKITDRIKHIDKAVVIPALIFVIAAVSVILAAVYKLDVSVVSVCALVILEAVLAALLNRIPLWIHGLVIIAQIAFGIIFGRLILMVLMDILYLIAVVILFVRNRDR